MIQNDWKNLHWGDLATIEYGKGLAGYENASGSFPVYGTNGVIGFHSEALYNGPGVIIGRKGAYRGIHYSKTPFYVIDTAFYLMPKIEFDMRWAYYQLLTQDINSMDSGSAIPSTSRPDFYALPVAVPLILEQRSIAELLGSLDDKIEHNRRMNETLEEIAQALFKHWFIDNPEVKEWELKPLPEIIDLNPPRLLRFGEIAPYLEMKNMPTKGNRAIQWIDRPFSSGTKFVNGDTLLARITPCLENGKTAYVDFLLDGQTGWGSTEYIVFRPKPPIPPEYGYYLARSESVRNYAIQNMTGTSGRQRTPVSCFDNYEILEPPSELLKQFGDFVNPIMSKIRANDELSRTLVSIRDVLLPRLISRKVRIKNIESEL